jgi:hypothetical protein
MLHTLSLSLSPRCITLGVMVLLQQLALSPHRRAPPHRDQFHFSLFPAIYFYFYFPAIYFIFTRAWRRFVASSSDYYVIVAATVASGWFEDVPALEF